LVAVCLGNVPGVSSFESILPRCSVLPWWVLRGYLGLEVGHSCHEVAEHVFLDLLFCHDDDCVGVVAHSIDESLCLRSFVNRVAIFFHHVEGFLKLRRILHEW
jgi:hypothetical protein